uniref:Uncharacterized protein n=1 Tax=Tanacetum cinerariifolium TaxID=118510 RepID=A0A6L2M0D8_TANCI|nr:hypothetical protein [Tanacetum cinerariifolium]
MGLFCQLDKYEKRVMCDWDGRDLVWKGAGRAVEKMYSNKVNLAGNLGRGEFDWILTVAGFGVMAGLVAMVS